MASRGLTFISSVAATGSSTVNIDNCFTSTYIRYLIEVDLTTDGDQAINMRMRVGGATNSDGDHEYVNFFYESSSPSGGSGDNATSFPQVAGISASANPANFFTHLLVDNAQQTEYTSVSARTGFRSDASTTYIQMVKYIKDVTTSFDGFRLLSTANLTGTVSVWGFNI